MKKNILYLIAIVILAVFIFVPSVGNFVRSQLFPLEKIENATTLSDNDLNIQLKGINVPSTNLKDLKKDKVIFLNFWATWCPPCVGEFPSIQQLYEAKKDKVEFVLIAMDKEEKVRNFIKEKNYTSPVYLVETPLNEKILPKVFPTTFLLDKNGKILIKETGSRDWNSEDTKSFIEKVQP